VVEPAKNGSLLFSPDSSGYAICRVGIAAFAKWHLSG